jgi:hypothetical protein
MNATLLSVLCTKVSEDSSLDEETKEKARNLKTEWVSLQNAPSPNLREEGERDAKREQNRRKMAEFLSDLMKRL